MKLLKTQRDRILYTAINIAVVGGFLAPALISAENDFAVLGGIILLIADMYHLGKILTTIIEAHEN